MMFKKEILFLLPVLFLISGCGNDRDDERVPLFKLTDSGKLNKFVVNCTQELYLWESLTDWSQYDDNEAYESYPDPYKLFEKFVYQDDRWSGLTNDIDSWKNTIKGVSTTYGYTLIRGKFSNANSYFSIVLYTTPDSPAAKAGVKRGDIIVGIGGGDITDENYEDLFYSSSISIQLGYVNEEGSISRQPGSIHMDAVEMYENPINAYRVIEKGGRKIGYLCYTAYISTSEQELQAVFSTFKKAGVTDVILDLRYNGGGHARTAQVLSSILAPGSAVAKKDVYLTQQWNDLYNRYWNSKGEDHTEYFVDTLAVNMDLKQLYVLTSENTASASEATLIGLKPYMDVVLIGGATHGKYYGGYVLSVDDYYSGSTGYYKEHYLNISNWGMYLMVYRYANRDNYPDFSGGIEPEPDNLVAEDYFDLKPFGDESDPLLGRALERITGEKYVKKRNLHSEKISSNTLFTNDVRSGNPLKGMLIHTEPLPHIQVE